MTRWAASHLLILLLLTGLARAEKYPWLDGHDISRAIAGDVAPPPGYVRVEVDSGSFAAWLRGLPLKKKGTEVRLYNGRLKASQNVVHRVVDIDIGDKDLLQCADAAIRLRAEYLYQRADYTRIEFNFTSGDTARFRDWIEGFRPRVSGNQVTWSKSAAVDSSYAALKDYLQTVYTYAGSYSLGRDLKRVTDPADMQPGDLIIEGGFPGHVVIVVDVARSVDSTSTDCLFLLAQGFTPAQDIHLLVNFANRKVSPWYRCRIGNVLETPEWRFEPPRIYRFR